MIIIIHDNNDNNSIIIYYIDIPGGQGSLLFISVPNLVLDFHRHSPKPISPWPRDIEAHKEAFQNLVGGFNPSE